MAPDLATYLWLVCSCWLVATLIVAHHCGCDCRTLSFRRGYPELVLQESPRVAILMKDLVIYMTQGPKPADQPFVLHFDETQRFVARSKLSWQQLTDLELSIHDQQQQYQPQHIACECQTCICSGCLFYGTQSDNAVTGSHHEHQFKKKKKGWQYNCPGLPRCPMCQKYTVYKIRKAAAKKATKSNAPSTAEAATPAAAIPRRSKRAIVMKRKHSFAGS